MTTLNLLTDNGFKSINNITNINVYSPDFKLNKVSYVNKFENFYFPGYEINLSTGLNFTCRSTQRFKGLIFSLNEIKNSLDTNIISDYKLNDYLFTPFIDKDLFDRDYSFNYLVINQSLKSDFYDLEGNFKDKIVTDYSTYFREDVAINIDESFYKFLAIALVRGHCNTDSNYISFKFNKNNQTHLRIKSDLLEFFNKNNLNYELSEYNKYYYINYSDLTLVALVAKFFKELYNDLSNIFNNEFQDLFLLYLYAITKNSYYMSYNTYLFFKKLAYNNNLVISVEKNPINSNHNYSLKSKLNVDSEDNNNNVPDIIYIENGYLTKILKVSNVNLKGDVELLPNYLLVC